MPDPRVELAIEDPKDTCTPPIDVVPGALLDTD